MASYKTPGTDITVEEVDGSPSVLPVSRFKFTNSTVTDSGSGTVTVATGTATFATFTTTTTLGAFDVTTVGDGVVAYVQSLKDFFVLNKTSAATADTTDFLIVAATGVTNARWLRCCIANQQWLTTTTWYIDPATGSNEGAGAVGTPLKSWAELSRRVRGLTFNTATVTVNIVTSLANTDPIDVNFSVVNASATPANGSLTIVGTRTITLSGTLTSVTNLDPTTGTGGTPNAIADTGLGAGGFSTSVNKLIRFFNGVTFRCAAWVAKDTGTKTARISCAINNNNNTAATQTNPVVADNYEVYSLTTAPGVFVTDGGFKTLLSIQNMDITPSGSTVLFANQSPTLVRLQNSSIGKTVGIKNSSSLIAYNCLIAGGGTHTSSFNGALTFNAGLFSGSVNASTTVTFEGRIAHSILSAAVMFQGLQVLFNQASADDSKLAIFDSPSATNSLRLQSTSRVTLTELWGSGNAPTSAFTAISKYGQELDVLTTLNISHSATYDVAMGGEAVFKLFADMTNRTDFRDTYGNVMRAPGGGSPAVFGGSMSSGMPAMYNCGEDMVPARVVRVSGGTVVKATADTSAHATGVVGVSTSQNTSGGRVVVVSSGYAVLKFDADPTDGDLCYLSPTNAGQATSTVPASASTNQKLRLGYVLRAFGSSSGLAVVRLHPELIPITSDGVAP